VVDRGGGPDFGRGHGAEIIFVRAKRKAPPKGKPRPCGRGLNFRYGEGVQSRWPSSCSRNVNRLMKFKYSDSAPVIAARSATAPPCEA
jgi:hypothetical protein